MLNNPEEFQDACKILIRFMRDTLHPPPPDVKKAIGIVCGSLAVVKHTMMEIKNLIDFMEEVDPECQTKDLK